MFADEVVPAGLRAFANSRHGARRTVIMLYGVQEGVKEPLARGVLRLCPAPASPEDRGVRSEKED